MNNEKVQLRAQVKMAEKRLKNAQDKETLISNKIRAALKGGDRPRAEKLAQALNEARDDLAFAKQQLHVAKAMEVKGRNHLQKMGQDMKRLESMQTIAKVQDGLAKSLSKLSGGPEVGGSDDMIRKLHQDAALQEARLDIAMDDAAMHTGSAEMEETMRQSNAEDILRQMELDMGIEGM